MTFFDIAIFVPYSAPSRTVGVFSIKNSKIIALRFAVITLSSLRLARFSWLSSSKPDHIKARAIGIAIMIRIDILITNYAMIPGPDQLSYWH